jgi:hypothetical protein
MAKSQATLAMAILAVISTVPASADSWYPKDCIAIDYCAPVENVIWSVPTTGAAPQIIVASANRTAVVQRNFAVLESKDGRAHVCMRYDSFGDLEVTCLLVPIRGF